MKIIWTELAVEKLEEIADYIASDDPSAALKWVNKMRKAVNMLKDFSEIGRKVPEIKRDNIYEIIEDNYRIIYKINSNIISVLTIRNCRQLLNKNDIIKTN